MLSKLINGVLITTLALTSTIVLAGSQPITCPTLTTNDVRDIIDNGFIGTNQDESLAEQAGLTRPQVLINEPTANPFDTFYIFEKVVRTGSGTLFFVIDSVLAQNPYEAKHRVKKILLKDATEFTGTYDPDRKICSYKEIDASPSIPGYPFKSSYETVFFGAGIIDPAAPEAMHRGLFKKHSH